MGSFLATGLVNFFSLSRLTTYEMSVGTSEAWRHPLRCRDARNIFKSLNSWIVNYFDCVWSLKRFLALKVQMKTLKYNFHMFAVGYIALHCEKFSVILRKTTQYVRISIILLVSDTICFGFEFFAISKPLLFLKVKYKTSKCHNTVGILYARK